MIASISFFFPPTKGPSLTLHVEHDSSIAHLTNSTQEAAHVDINPYTGTLSSWHDEDGCDFRGLNMMNPDPHQPHGRHDRFEKHGDAVFRSRRGSAGMFWEGDHLRWDHKNFDIWLVCDSDNGEEVELKYWATKVHGTWKEDPRRCAAVKLRVVE